MMRFPRILVSTIILALGAVGLSACGQQGPLYLPTQPAAAHRATLPQTLWPARAVIPIEPPAPALPSSTLPPALPASASQP